MAEYKGKQGRWVTTKEGRHLFIEEDSVDKQEREIREREESTKKLTAEMRADEDFIEGGHDYPEMGAEDIIDSLIEEWQDFSDSGGDGIPGDVYAKDDLSDSNEFSKAEIEKIMSKDFDYDLACKFMAWYAVRDMSKPYTKAKIAQELNSMIGNRAQLNDKAINAIMKYIK